MGHLKVRIGGDLDSWVVQARVGDGTIEGRMGGELWGADIRFSYSFETGRLSGRLGGGLVGKDLSGRLTTAVFSGRVGGELVGYDLEVQTVGDSLRGRCGGGVFGFDLELRLNEEALFGRIGGGVFGFDVTGTLTDVPLLLAGVVLAGAYYLHKEHDRRNSANGGTH